MALCTLASTGQDAGITGDTSEETGLLSILWQVIILPLPWRVRRPLLQLLPGVEVSTSARLGISIVNAERFSLAPGAVIGHLTVVKGLSELKLDNDARIGNLNWITAVPENSPDHFRAIPNRDPSLRLEAHAAITHRHMIDCTGGVTVEAFATIAGWHSQIITHGFAFREPAQHAAPIVIGHHSFVGSKCVLVKGSEVPARSIIGAGSVFEASGEQPLGLFRGNPARRVGDLDADLGYFHRDSGFIE